MSGPAPRAGYPGILRYERPTRQHPLRPGRRTYVVAGGAVVLVLAGWGALQLLRARRVTAVRVQEVVGPGAQHAVEMTEVGSARGLVVARQIVTVYPRRRGTLSGVSVTPGSTVRAFRGVIARLENREAAAEAIIAESLLSRVRGTLIRAQGGTDAAAIRAANRDVTQALERLRRAQAELDETYVGAPMTGTVFQVLAVRGDTVGPPAPGWRGRGIITMIDQTVQQVHVDVPGPLAARLRRNQDVRIVVDTVPRRRFVGVIADIAPGQGRGGATLVKVAFLERDRRIFPDFSATVTFLERPAERTAQAVYVDAGAVRADAGQSVVWVVAQGRLQRRVVDAGPVTGQRRLIRAGLVGGELIVIDGPAGLRQGQRVRVLRPAGTSDAAGRDSSARAAPPGPPPR